MRISVATACLLVSLPARPATAGQSLGQVAADEAARRQTVTAPARVITNTDLRAGPPSPFVEPPASGAADDAPRFVSRTPARFRGGSLPQIPIQAVSGAEIAVEAAVSADGRVTDIAIVRDAAPFTEFLASAVRGWQFAPAVDAVAAPSGQGEASVAETRVASKVLVIGLFRPPALFPGTLGTPSADVGRPSENVPYPTTPLTLPVFPPNALMDDVVILELAIGPEGNVARTRVVRSAAIFDQPALDAVAGMRFRPARVHGRPASSFAYVVAAFRQPVTP
jgi:TonB family protein